MRVAIIGKCPLENTRLAGGVQAASAYLVGELRLIDDLDLHLVTISYAMPQHDEHFQAAGIKLHLLPGLPRFEFIQNYRTYQTQLNETLARIQPDVVHAQDAAQDAYVALRSGYPAVITVHGVRREDAKYIGSFVKRIRNRVHSAVIERRNVRQTQHLIAISRYVTEYFAATLRPETRVYHIPNAVHRRFFELEDAGDGCTVLFAGRLIRRKRPLDLVQAFARVAQNRPDARLRMAGECRSDALYAESVRAFIRRTGLDKQVHLLGPLPEDQLLHEFSRCDVLALPSVQETAPMVIAQAMAAGKPVVATNVGGVAEMINDGRTGFLCNVGDIEGMADALQRLLQDRSLRVEMGRAGRRKAKDDYYAPTVAHKTLEVYRTVAGGT